MRGNAVPIGVFDSGLGGLSVLREMRGVLPRETFCYVGDTLQVPWGGRDLGQIRAFSVAIARFLIEEQHCRALVIACNTATSVAADTVRETFAVPVVAMEPGIKPAVGATRTGRIAVLATEKTLASERLERLVARWASTNRGVSVITRPCPGWVEAVEAGDWDSPATLALVAHVVEPLVAGGVDTLVLGCTHYPFLRPLIEQVVGPTIALVDTGPAVARQVERVLTQAAQQGNFPALPNVSPEKHFPVAPVRAWVTGDVDRAALLARRCVGADAPLSLHQAHWIEGSLHDATKRRQGQSGPATDLY